MAKKKTGEITVKISLKVKRELYEKIEKWGKDNDAPDSIGSCLKLYVEGWFDHWDALIDKMEKAKKASDLLVPNSLLLGPDGQPMGKA